MFESIALIKSKKLKSPKKPINTMEYKNLTIIGTSHIAKQSMEEVEKSIREIKPGFVAIELDKKRYYGLTSNVKRKVGLKDIRRIGIKGYLFNIIGAWAEKKLGSIVGVEPGIDMLTAINTAKETKSKIALIDQDIEITLKKLSKQITWKEKFRFIWDIVKATIFKKSQMKELGIDEDFDLRKVPPKKLIKKLMKKTKERYPNFYRVLVVERNYIMAYKLLHLMEKHPEDKIIAVLGAGHTDEILDIIKKPDTNFPAFVG